MGKFPPFLHPRYVNMKVTMYMHDRGSIKIVIKPGLVIVLRAVCQRFGGKETKITHDALHVSQRSNPPVQLYIQSLVGLVQCVAYHIGIQAWLEVLGSLINISTLSVLLMVPMR